MNRPLVLVGGGGHCKSVIEAAESAGYVIKGVLDIPLTLGNKILDYEVIGNDNDIPKYVEECDFVITLGFIKNPSLRIKLHQFVKDVGGALATIVASSAYVSKHALLGEGTVVLHQANINAGARIGKSVIINSCANIEHDVIIEDFCHISTNTVINGSGKIGKASFVGSSSVLANNVTIGNNVTVGVGSVVLQNIPGNTFCFGNPAHHNIHDK